MIVMKFGGTSVEDATAIRRLISIVRRQLDRRPVVIVSAMGKTTNGLLECARLAAENNIADAHARLAIIADHHFRTARELALPDEYDALHDALEERFIETRVTLENIAVNGAITPAASDAIASRGELLSSLVVAAAFRGDGVNGVWVDVRPLMRTSDDFTRAAVQFDIANPLLKAGFEKALEHHGLPVSQGFIGSTADGATTTIGRGGSDYSAAIIGAALGAGDIQIWTDVDGIMTTDPRIISAAAKIKVISFAEAAELAYFGAKVLHPATLRPAVSRDIPVHVCNSRRPDVEGTAIVREAPPSTSYVKAIAFKRGITVLNVSSDRMLMAHGFLARLFEVFERHETAVDMVSTSEVSVSMTLDDTRNLEAIVRDLGELGDVTVEKNMALICLVGDRLRVTPGLAKRIFSSIDQINVSMISHGASTINVSFVVSDDQVEAAVTALHNEFFHDLDEATFEIPATAHARH
ncbi:MAG: lysine-sensitive aspartokinase 3 [Blastocatellia bacterium]